MPALVQRISLHFRIGQSPRRREAIPARITDNREPFCEGAMFPKEDTISEIVSNTARTVFKRRLVDRVLHLWTEMAREGRFPRRDQIEPSVLGADWVNCLVIAVQSPVERSYFVEVGENLSVAHCPNDSLAGV